MKKNTSIFKEIFKINLLYSNPAYTEKAMKSEKYKTDPEKLFKSIGIKKHVLVGIFLMFIYTFFFAVIDYSKFPYVLDLSVGIFVLMNIFQTFTYFYNVFYESKDIDGYMVLPIEAKIVFRGKMAVILISTLELAIPIFPLFLMYMIRIKVPIILSILLGFLDFMIVFSFIIIINLVAMSIMSKSALLSKFKTRVINTITVIASIINVVFILAIQQISRNMSKLAISDKNMKVVYGPLSLIMKKYSSHLLTILLSFLMIYIFYKLFIRKIENNFYSYNRQLNSYRNNIKVEKTYKSKKSTMDNADLSNKFEDIGKTMAFDDRVNDRREKNLKIKTLFKYNLSLISDSTVISQTMMVMILPIIILYPQFENIKEMLREMDNASLRLFGLAICVVVGFVYNIYPNVLHSVILSLDGENYNYIKSLPISEKEYLKNKLAFSTIILSSFSTVIVLSVCIYIKVPLAYILMGLVLMWLLSYSLGSQWLVYDHKNILTSWQNSSEIYSRTSIGLNILIVFMIFIVANILIGVILLALNNNSNNLSNILLVLIVLLAIISSSIALFRTNNYLKKNNIK